MEPTSTKAMAEITDVNAPPISRRDGGSPAVGAKERGRGGGKEYRDSPAEVIFLGNTNDGGGGVRAGGGSRRLEAVVLERASSSLSNSSSSNTRTAEDPPTSNNNSSTEDTPTIRLTWAELDSEDQELSDEVSE